MCSSARKISVRPCTKKVQAAAEKKKAAAEKRKRKRLVSGGAVKKPPRKKKKPPPKWIFVDCWMNGSIWQNEWIIMQCFCDLELDGMFMKLDVFKVEIPWRLKSKNPPRKTFMSWLGLWTTTVIKSLKSGIFNVHFGNNQFSKRASGYHCNFLPLTLSRELRWLILYWRYIVETK